MGLLDQNKEISKGVLLINSEEFIRKIKDGMYPVSKFESEFKDNTLIINSLSPRSILGINIPITIGKEYLPDFDVDHIKIDIPIRLRVFVPGISKIDDKNFCKSITSPGISIHIRLSNLAIQNVTFNSTQYQLNIIGRKSGIVFENCVFDTEKINIDLSSTISSKPMMFKGCKFDNLQKMDFMLSKGTAKRIIPKIIDKLYIHDKLIDDKSIYLDQLHQYGNKEQTIIELKPNYYEYLGVDKLPSGVTMKINEYDGITLFIENNKVIELWNHYRI